jgi:hypothetical protein
MYAKVTFKQKQRLGSPYRMKQQVLENIFLKTQKYLITAKGLSITIH